MPRDGAMPRDDVSPKWKCTRPGEPRSPDLVTCPPPQGETRRSLIKIGLKAYSVGLRWGCAMFALAKPINASVAA